MKSWAIADWSFQVEMGTEWGTENVQTKFNFDRSTAEIIAESLLRVQIYKVVPL